MADTRSTAAKQFSRLEGRMAKRPKDFAYTQEAVERMNKLEAQLQVKMVNDKDLQMGFGNVTSYFKRIANMTPEQQAVERESIRKQAEDIYADYFGKQRTRVTEDFDKYFTRLNRDYKFATADEEMALKEKMKGLDRDTVAAVGSAFRDVVNRGLGASGALQQIANQVISQRRIAADQVKQISEVAMRNLRATQQDRSEDASLSRIRTEEDMKHQQGLTLQSEERQIFNDRNIFSLQQQDAAGVNQITPRDMSLPEGDPLDPMTVRIRNMSTPSQVPARPLPEPLPTNVAGMTAEERRNIRIARNNIRSNATR